MSTAEELFGTGLAEVGRRATVDPAPTERKAQPFAEPVHGPIEFVIYGQPASKANSREIGILKFKDKETGQDKVRPSLRKSDEALAYEKSALQQIPPKARVQLQGKVRVTLRIFYASERPDLDESIVLDVMQDRWHKPKGAAERVLVQRGVYRNDRQVREKHVFHGIDPRNPRTEVRIESIEPQGGLL